MNRVIISIIIAVYNNEHYVAKALDCVLNQATDAELSVEVIAVDDGSTDNTSAVIDEMAKHDDRITVIHQGNQWIYASFNNGIKEAKGEYIYILNSDDLLFEGSIQLLIDSIHKYNHPDVIWTKVICQDVDENQNVLSEHDMNKDVVCDEYIDSIDKIHDRWIFLQKSELSGNQANLYKRELALNHPFDNTYYAGDVLFNISIADDIKSMAILSSPVYRYLTYNIEGFNASVGKYYGYEHQMFSRVMNEEIRLYRMWGCEDKYLDYSVLKRLKSLSYEITILNFGTCKLTFKDKIIKIFNEIADSEVRKMARRVNREREYESRILNGTRELIELLGGRSETPVEILPLIDHLPIDYRDNVNWESIDEEAIQNAICSNINKDRIGKIFYSEDW